VSSHFISSGLRLLLKYKNVYSTVSRPCILIFDSLAGSSRSRAAAHDEVVNTLRDYLHSEYLARRPVEAKTKAYDKSAVLGLFLTVPQQNNYSDCGVYVLQYAESFMEVSFTKIQ
jgi:Ulp1 family protease